MGRGLLTELVALAGAHGFHAVMARIVGGHEASIGLHQACGFELVGVEREVGRKFGRWLDVVLMQRLIDPGEASPGGRSATVRTWTPATRPRTSSSRTRTGAPGACRNCCRTGPVVLYFYPMALTRGCTAESCHFRDLAAEFAGPRRPASRAYRPTGWKNRSGSRISTVRFPAAVGPGQGGRPGVRGAARAGPDPQQAHDVRHRDRRADQGGRPVGNQHERPCRHRPGHPAGPVSRRLGAGPAVGPGDPRRAFPVAKQALTGSTSSFQLQEVPCERGRCNREEKVGTCETPPTPTLNLTPGGPLVAAGPGGTSRRRPLDPAP